MKEFSKEFSILSRFTSTTALSLVPPGLLMLSFMSENIMLMSSIMLLELQRWSSVTGVWVPSPGLCDSSIAPLETVLAEVSYCHGP